MRTRDALRRHPVTIDPAATITRAAATMDQAGVGALVVVEDGAPTGIVTDRDITVRATARRYPADARIDTVMTTEPVTLGEDDDLGTALEIFRTHAVHRLPVVDGSGHLVGMLTADDLLVNLVADLGDLARPILGPLLFGPPQAPLPLTTV